MKKFEGFMCGVNLGGWLSQCVATTKEHYDNFITEKDIEIIASMGMDHVRLPIDYDFIENEDGTPKEEGYVYVENCISWCKKHGIHLLLDLHKTFGYTFDPLDHGDKEIFFKDEALQERFYALWREISKRFGNDYETVAFDLLNEVVSASVVDEWNAILKKAVEEIRKIAPEVYIVFGGVCYNNVSSVPLLPAPFADKLVYNFHCYDPFVFTHQKAYWVDNMPSDFEMSYPDSMENYCEKSKMFGIESTKAIYDSGVTEMGPAFFESIFAPAIETAEKYDVALYCGEYGVIDQAPLPDSLRWLNDINLSFDRHGIGRALWNYKNKDFGIVDPHYAPIIDDLPFIKRVK